MKNVKYYNAGAGSGKTFKLTHVLADRIRDGLNPAEVILTTFTTAAAADFKERARAVLYEEGLQDKAAMLDQAIIGTVHAVGEVFIKKYWYLLGLSPEMNVMDEDSTRFYINQSLASLPTADDIQLFRNFRKAFDLKHEEDGVQGRTYEMFWKDWLNNIIEKAVAYRVDDMTNSIEYSIRQIQKFFKPNHDFDLSPDRFITSLQTIADIASNDSTQTAAERANTAKSFLQKQSWDIHDFIELGSFLQKLPKSFSKKLPELPNLMAEVAGIWHSYPVCNLMIAVVRRIFAMADEWREQYKSYKQERRIIDFNDMEYYFLELLKRPDIAAEISGRYKCLMVDEFQDSSPIQVDIFKSLSELVEESYWCGDSKQAIYGFRGADTDLTEAVVNMIAPNKLESLDTSYRSEPDIVKLCNGVFTKVFAGKIEPNNIVLKEHRKKTSEGPSLIHWASPYPTKEQFFCNIAAYIDDLIIDKGIPCSDIAVLAYSNSELDSVARALNQIGIPTNHGSELLNQLRETELINAILTLTIDEHNQLAKAKIVYLTEQGWMLPHLIDDRLQNIADYQQYLQRLAAGEEVPEEEVPGEWLNEQPLIRAILNRRKEWIGQSVSALVESILVELNLRAILKRWGYGWEQREANLYQIVALAEKYEQYCQTMTLGATTTGFLDYLVKVEMLGAGDNDGVVLSTYHGSKGLQWKNVILLSLDRNVIDEKKLLQRGVFGIQKIRSAEPTREQLFPEMIISLIPWPFGRSKAPEDIAAEVMADEIYATVKRTALEESARLLYVGMTRAEDRLITTSKAGKSLVKTMTWFYNLGINLTKIPDSGEVDLFDTGLPISLGKQSCFEEDNDSNPTTTPKDFASCTGTISSYPEKFIAPSKTGITEKGIVKFVTKRDEIIPLRGKPDMSEVGNCIHNIYAAFTGDKECDLEIARQLIAAFHFEKVLPHAAAVIEAREYLEQWLKEQHGPCIAQYHELPFTQDIGNQIVRGSMDLVWETEKGCILVDFKTFPGTEISVTEENSAHYAGNYKPQFDCYRSALIAAGKQVIAEYVYYPVNGIIIEMLP